MGLSSKQVYEDTFNWPQMDGLEILTAEAARGAERKNPAPMRCPRCDSTNTKFCYYNNYSRSQPRHFCRACRRHWTAGGTLRNVPVGGGRKNKRRKTTSDAAASDDPPPTRSAAAPFIGEIDDTVLPDDFCQVLHQPGPPPVSAFVDKSDWFGISLPPHSLPFMYEVGSLRSDFDFVFDSVALPFTAATSSSSCSTYSFGGHHEGLLMDGSTEGAWVQESPVLPEGFWDFYDGPTDFSCTDLRQQE